MDCTRSAVFAVFAFGALAACKHPSPLEGEPAITIDGEWDEPQWNATALRGVFAVDGNGEGGQARPYSEVRAFVRGDVVYLGLYAADEDILSTDHFDVVVGTLSVSFDAAGRASVPNIPVGVDRDGTLDASADDDEEWVIEAAIPRRLLGPAPYSLHASRCDVTHSHTRHCGSWSGSLRP